MVLGKGVGSTFLWRLPSRRCPVWGISSPRARSRLAHSKRASTFGHAAAGAGHRTGCRTGRRRARSKRARKRRARKWQARSKPGHSSLPYGHAAAGADRRKGWSTGRRRAHKQPARKQRARKQQAGSKPDGHAAAGTNQRTGCRQVRRRARMQQARNRPGCRTDRPGRRRQPWPRQPPPRTPGEGYDGSWETLSSRGKLGRKSLGG